MHGHRQQVEREVVEGVTKARGRKSGFRTGDVEPDDAVRSMAHGEFGDFEAAVGVPHGGDELTDPDVMPARLRVGDALLDPLLHRLDRLVEAQPTLQMLLGSPSHLAVDDPIGHQISDEFARHPGQRRFGLHH